MTPGVTPGVTPRVETWDQQRAASTARGNPNIKPEARNLDIHAPKIKQVLDRNRSGA